jgi:hypothetical protein
VYSSVQWKGIPDVAAAATAAAAAAAATLSPANNPLRSSFAPFTSSRCRVYAYAIVQLEIEITMRTYTAVTKKAWLPSTQHTVCTDTKRLLHTIVNALA